jgi:hypothetical protein
MPKYNHLTLPIIAAIAVALLLPVVPVQAYEIGPLNPPQRANQAYRLRHDAAVRNLTLPLLAHPDNGDEIRYPNRINSYTKGLPHNANGIVDATAYHSLYRALSTGNNADFEAIPMGVPGANRLRDPQSAYAFVLEGRDAHSFSMPSAPEFASAWQAADAIEVLWQALSRDVPFEQYGSDPLIAQAIADMNRFSDYRGPRAAGRVTANTLFRGVGVGETNGPYLSQFLLQSIPFGATKVEQKYNVPVAGNDHLTNWNEWLLIQNGGKPSGLTVEQPDSTPRYLRNGRDLAQYVLKDFVFQSYSNAALILNGFGANAASDTYPFKNSLTQTEGPLFGVNHALDMLSRISMSSQHLAWYQKWLVHRRARPEVFFARLHKRMTDAAFPYPIHAEALSSPALAATFNRHASYLLPTATASGSPLHPSYPAGHATMAGAAVTMLKAFYKGSFVIPNPKVPSADGTTLVAYTGPALTVEGELNKLASNISLGRDIAGVHYRSDGDLGVALGEEFAISVLRELVNTYAEDFTGFQFNRFDGTPITISKKP